MIREEINDMEIASPSVVSKAARDFAAALVETPQFKAFEQASALCVLTRMPNALWRHSRRNRCLCGRSDVERSPC
jgi:hypothetical protein